MSDALIDRDSVLELIKSEGDRHEFEHAGLRCLLRRTPKYLIWCGYVEVPEGHPLHGIETDDDRINRLTVHGGVTWVDKMGAFEYCIGFDCNHGYDYTPYIYSIVNSTPDQYRTKEYAEAECRRLAEQIANYKAVEA